MSFNYSKIDLVSLETLAAQEGSSVCWLVLGLIGAISNGILFIVIIKTKHLRSNFNFCLMHAAVADSIYCFFCFVTGAKRLYLLWTKMGEASKPLDCFWHMLPEM